MQLERHIQYEKLWGELPSSKAKFSVRRSDLEHLQTNLAQIH